MALLSHSIYEIRKGVRRLAMVTVNRLQLPQAQAKLNRAGIPYAILHTQGSPVNIILGCAACIAVLQSFGEQNLSRLTPEQDFILGSFLGYDLSQQCQRYLSKTLRAKVA